MKRKWAMIFASAIHQRGGIPWREAISLGWIAATELENKRCFTCGDNPERGGKRRGSRLCEHCYHAP